MAETLPERANLAWLKKTAKQQLRDLRTSNPDTKLAHAQLALARSYGFASWRALKAEIERRQSDGSAAAPPSEAAAKQFLRGADVAARDKEHDNTPAGWAQVSITVSNNPKCRDVVDYFTGIGAGPRS